ncbi:MAG: hypothetical protein UW60_C0003G0031 [Candidatus Woesebacteria bacterium GW2011_GWA2_44_33]|uniref:Chaperone protein DnaJ n=1 Tax=Candidatus Woesebacteria bacterium GW2011_GWA2_44_33 TaxID=1618564 RepID=A0A0G1J8F5_9BACT|nr:MAG: hypothetical protein UW60_C0003G0031 [Candidatus Woesebacteria bacterium GW2011_GWA2_44_33]
MKTKDREIRTDYPVNSVVAQKCPVCNGFGTLKFGSLLCHACEGKGYILIPDQKFCVIEELEERK